MVEHERTGPVDRMNWTFSRIAMWAPAFIIAIMFYEVVLRYVFVKPTLWVNEMSLWVAGGVYVTAGLYAMQQRSHIRIFVLYDMAPLWLRRVFDLMSTFCVLVFVFAVVWGGFGEAASKFGRWETFGTAYDPPIPATIKPLVLLTLAVLALQVVSNLIRDWPSNAIVRKTFDALATALIVFLSLWALWVVGFNEALSVPLKWRIGLAIFFLGIIAICLYGLVKDWNQTPVPFTEDRDPSGEIDLPKDLRLKAEENQANRKD